MQTQLLPLGNLVHVAQGRDVKMVLVDGEIVVKDARPLKVDRMPSDATLRRSPRALDAGERRLDTRRSQARDAARDHNPVPRRICASGFGAPEVPNSIHIHGARAGRIIHSIKSRGIPLPVAASHYPSSLMSCLGPTKVIE